MGKVDAIGWLVIATLSVAGCAEHVRQSSAAPPLPVRPPDVVQWSADFDYPGLCEYGRQAQDKLHRHAFVLGCHGIDFMGTWFCKPDAGAVVRVESVAMAMRAVLPRDTILVLVVCNPGHSKLGVRDVLYPPDSVWKQPGAAWRDFRGAYECCVGSVDEMTVDK